MTRKFAKIQHIDHNEPINKESHYEFIHHLQKSILLALREQGRLNAMQYRHAEEALLQQRRNRAKKILEQGRDNH